MSDRDDLDALFTAAGWISLSTESCDGLFCRRDSVVGILLAETPPDAAARAGGAQAELRERRNDRHNHYKDFYLVFIVRRFADDDLYDLERNIDDPHVCRKLLVERRDRTLADAIAELGLFLPLDSVSNRHASHAAPTESLSSEAWTLLRENGVAAIVNQLIDEEENAELS